MTLQDAGFKFSRRVETDGRASWCKRGEENMRAKKKEQPGRVFWKRRLKVREN